MPSENNTSRNATKLKIATAKHGKTDVILTPKEVTWGDFCDTLSRPKVGPKDGAYYIRGGDLTEPRRADETLREADLLIIDGDSSFDPETGEITTGAPPISQTVGALHDLGLTYFAHTTHSFDPAAGIWKYRIVIPAHMRNQGELEASVEWLMAQLHARGVYLVDVNEQRKWAQPWFGPRVASEAALSDFQHHRNDGKAFDVDAAVAWAKREAAANATVERARTEPPPVENKQPSVISEFNDRASLADVRSMLEARGYKFAGRKGETYRYISPTSESGTAGVVVFKGKLGHWCTYSHHGAHDPLSSKVCDPFELYAIFSHGGDRKRAVRAISPAKTSTGQDFGEGQPEGAAGAGEGHQLFIPAGDFAASWKPAEYLVDGMIQRGYCYSLTSPTGHGKTAVIMMLAACIGTGRDFAGVETLPGKVGYFAAENPNDVQARWIGMMEEMAFASSNVWFCPETVDLDTTFSRIAKEVKEAGGFDLIVVDTSQAFFAGEDENSNTQMVTHAKAMRKLTTLPGNPCVIILAHPVKNPSRDNLLPRGGGGFLAEVDGNLTLWNDGGNLVMHHQGKFRGAGFAPVNFTLKPVNPTRLKDAKGRQIPTIVAEFLTSDQYDRRLVDNATDQDKVLILIAAGKGKMPVAEMASKIGWLSARGVPNKAKVFRVLQQLEDLKLVKKDRAGRARLTEAGKTEISAKAKALGIDAAGEDVPEEDLF